MIRSIFLGFTALALATPALASVTTMQQGSFAYLDSYTGPGYGTISGRGQLARENDGTSTGSIVVSSLGFSPGDTYMAHLHALPCADNGGPHYQNPACSGDPDYSQSGGSCPVNDIDEMWLGFVVDPAGRGVMEASVNWQPTRKDSKSLSIVVHDTPNAVSGAGAKMLCVDLGGKRSLINRTTYGTLGYINTDADGNVYTLKSAKMTRQKNGKSKVKVLWSGLRADFTYPSHVHSSPCVTVSNGGPHYTRDIVFAIAGTNAIPATAETEWWISFTSSSRGKGKATSTIPLTARADAQAVVLHDCLDSMGNADYSGVCPGGKPRIACIDFQVSFSAN